MPYQIFLLLLLGHVARTDDIQFTMMFEALERLVRDSREQMDELELITIESGLDKQIVEGSGFLKESSSLLEFHNNINEKLFDTMTRLGKKDLTAQLKTELAKDVIGVANLFIFTLSKSLELLPANSGSPRIEHLRVMLSLLYRDWARWRQSFKSYSGLTLRSPQGPLGLFRSTGGENIKIIFQTGHRMTIHIPVSFIANKARLPHWMHDLDCSNLRYYVTNELRIYLVDDDAVKECLGSGDIPANASSFLFSYDPLTNMLEGGFHGVLFTSNGDRSVTQEPWAIAETGTHADSPFGRFGKKEEDAAVEIFFMPDDRLRFAVSIPESGSSLDFLGLNLTFVMESNEVVLVADEKFKDLIVSVGDSYRNGMIRITSDPLEDTIIVTIKNRRFVCQRIFD